jgi:tRNA (adenine37-N6)-methyltransferase
MLFQRNIRRFLRVFRVVRGLKMEKFRCESYGMRENNVFMNNMRIQFKPIGYAAVAYAGKIPRHWAVSEAEGTLVIDEQYRAGLKDIQPGQRLVVLFYFHQNPPFTPDLLVQTPPHRGEPRGVFSTCSPHRPNSIGFSVLEVLSVDGVRIQVKGLDLLDGTPILDLKPYTAAE